MTEDEARQKWCPFYRVTELGWLGTATDNRGNTLEENVPAKCIASDCMAYRVTTYELQSDGSEVPHGVCGLAGK